MKKIFVFIIASVVYVAIITHIPAYGLEKASKLKGDDLVKNPDPDLTQIVTSTEVQAATSTAGQITTSTALLKPDLAASPPKDLRVWRKNRRIELRFTGGFANKGQGPFELVGEKKLAGPDRSVLVDQRVYLKNAEGSMDFPVGEIFWHGAHHHFHMENVALYVLEYLDKDSQVPLLQTKTSFCLADIIRDPKIKNFVKKPVYPFDCKASRQGLSVGWADVYQYTLPGQSFDITNLPAGKYRLSVTVNPENKFIDLKEDNDSAGITIALDPKKFRVKIIE